MDIRLDDTATLWQTKAREFADQELIPCEVDAELNDGRLAADVSARHHRLAVEAGFSVMDVPAAHSGHELRSLDQVAVWEQLGRVTNALCWCFAEPQSWMFEACSAAQIERYILPLIDGSRRECFAITEEGSGSELELETTAAKTGDGYRINGEKWYVTSANHADYFIVQAALADGPHAGEHALFFVDKASPGVERVRTPKFSHTFDHHHPIYRFTDVEVASEDRIGAEGDGMRFSHRWFRRERLMIAARCCGAMERLIEEATAFARERRAGGGRLIERQLIKAMLADCVTDWWAARLMTYETADAHDRGEPVKALHVRCSVVKLFASEAAGRVADRAVQIFGGRGYMRENAAERFSRELRVDRIWEGTSEIQRLIIGRALAKRGLKEM